jgi:hypothetical protein
LTTSQRAWPEPGPSSLQLPRVRGSWIHHSDEEYDGSEVESDVEEDLYIRTYSEHTVARPSVIDGKGKGKERARTPDFPDYNPEDYDDSESEEE